MQQRPYKQVDVFTAAPYYGNPLAVVLDGSNLSDAQMQHFARWTNLSETTFVLPPSTPQADYRVRIFTPGGELPFAGHPTLGSCHAWLEAGGLPRDAQCVVQECAVGLIRIQNQGTQRAFAAPACQRSAPSPALLAQVCSALGLQANQVLAAQLLDNGPQWLGLLLESPQTVLALQPNHLLLKNLKQKVGVAGVYSEKFAINNEAKIEVRAFAAPIGIEEDPVTGSLNASLAQWLLADDMQSTAGIQAPYVAAQGTVLGRAGRVHISQDASGQVWVGGQSVTCIDGTVQL